MGDIEDEVKNCAEPKCRADLSGDGALSIYCDICEGLYCTKCMNLPDITMKFFNMITKCENVKMACDKCLKFSFTSLCKDRKTDEAQTQQMKKLQKKVEGDVKALEKKIDVIKNVSDNIKDEMNTNLTYSKALKENMEEIQNDQQSNDTLTNGKDLKEVGQIICKQITHEITTKEKSDEIERAIIINGLKEANVKKFDERMKQETEKVESLIRDGVQISIPIIEKIQRLGKYNPDRKSARPMRVVFKDKLGKDKVLRNASNLKQADDINKTCYLNKEMNSEEKKELEEKIKEAKELNQRIGNEQKFFVVRGYPSKWRVMEKVRHTT